jgi:hypothetical protein
VAKSKIVVGMGETFESKLKDGDLTTMSNAIVMEVNFLAA